MSQLFPIYLNLRERRVLLVGGGNLAVQKLRSLQPSGALLHVIAPRAHPVIRAAATAGRLRWAQRRYASGDLDGAALVFAASDDAALNHRVVTEARRLGILANAVDDPPNCDFHSPAVIRRGPFSFAIASGGRFPGVTRALREVLEAWLPDRDAGPIAQLLELRRQVRRRSGDPDQRSQRLRALIAAFRREYLECSVPAADTAGWAPAHIAPGDPLARGERKNRWSTTP